MVSSRQADRVRHRIAEIELQPTTSKWKIKAELLVNDAVVHELPSITIGQPLRWTKLLICDVDSSSRIKLAVYERHHGLYTCFTSEEYRVSDVARLPMKTISVTDRPYTAVIKFLTQEEAERSFANGVEKLEQLERSSGTLSKLGRARAMFASMLQFGSLVADIHPAAKTVFAVCTIALEKLEEQGKCDEDLGDLVESLVGMVALIEKVKEHARLKHLQAAVEDFLNLIEDVSVFAIAYESKGAFARALRSFVDSSMQDQVGDLVKKFETIKDSFDRALATQTAIIVVTANDRDLLGRLNPVEPSGYDPTRACQEGTRQGVLDDIDHWIETPEPSPHLLWVHGQAGIGKSAVATSACKQLLNKQRPTVTFFCKRDDPALRDPLRLINSIVHGLSNRCPSYGKLVAAAIESNSELCTSHLGVRYEGLIKKPLEKLNDPSLPPLVVVVDALDECGTDDSRGQLLKHLRDMTLLVPWLKLIITSRPDKDIRSFMDGCDSTVVSKCDVHGYKAADDIRAFIEARLAATAAEDDWPADSINQLCSRAGELFVWAATACKFILNSYDSRDRLRQLIERGHSAEALSDLDALYTTVIRNSMFDQKEDNKKLVRRCIGAILAASERNPLPISALGYLMREHVKPAVLEKIVKRLGAVLYTDETVGGAVRFYHPSFADYATDQSRSDDLWVDPVQRNAELGAGCLQVMEQELQFNICELETSYLLNAEVPDLDTRIKLKISEQLHYSCTYWISHLVDSPQGKSIQEVEKMMDGPQLMYWLEVLSLLNKVHIVLPGLRDLRQWLPANSVSISQCVWDAYRFVFAFFDAIAASTPHLYLSALAFAPKQSGVVRRLAHLFPNTTTVTRGGDETWPEWLRTIPHPDRVSSLCVSRDGHMLATGSDDGFVRLFDLQTGRTIGKPLQVADHSDRVTCVAFSPDGTRVMSGFGDGTMLMWDAKTSSAVDIHFSGHEGDVNSVAFSPDGSHIVSCSHDGTIRIWDVKTGNLIGEPLEAVGEPNGVSSVAFSPDGTRIVSGSYDPTMQIWDSKTGKPIGDPLVGHSNTISSVAFSPDGTRIVSGSNDSTLQIWDTRAGKALGKPLTGHSDVVTSVAFSFDGTRIVSGSWDKTVRMWDAKTGAAVSSFLCGHSDWVTSVAFSPDGIHIVSASTDNTVLIWDARAGRPADSPSSDIGRANSETAIACSPTLTSGSLVGHSGVVSSVAFSPDGIHIASGSYDDSVQIWDASTGSAVIGPLVHEGDVNSVAFSPDGTLIVSGSTDKVRMWDAKTGSPVGIPLVGNTTWVTSVAFSPDGSRIAAGSGGNETVRMWDVKTLVESSFAGHTDTVNAVAFSPDGTRVVSCSGAGDMTVRIWDPQTGNEVVSSLAGHSNEVMSVAYSPDGSCIVSTSRDETLQIWDAKTGEPIGSPLEDPGVAISVAFSPDGARIISGSFDATIKMWDVKTRSVIGRPFVGHTDGVTSVAFSPDGTRIVSGSYDKTIRMWDAGVDDIHSGQSENSNPSFQWPAHSFGLPPHPKHSDWVSHDKQSLALWLPPNYRRPYDPRVRYCISADPTTSTVYLDFSKFVHGTSWTSVACDSVLHGRA